MTTLLEAAKQALEVLENWMPNGSGDPLITNLRIAIAQAEKVEPSGWWNPKYPSITVQLTKPLDGGGWEPFYTHPAPTIPEIKPHQIAQLVNELRDIAVKYHDHQSLRERLAGPVHELWKAPIIPEGWKLVPIEPTREMLWQICPASADLHEWAVNYQAMLQAAPTPEDMK